MDSARLLWFISSYALLPPPAPTILRLWLLLTSNYLFVFTDGNLAEVCRLSPQRRSPVLSRKNRESTFFPLGDTLSNAIHVLPPPPKTFLRVRHAFSSPRTRDVPLRIAGEAIDVLTELKLICMQLPLARESVPNSAGWYDTRGVFPMMAYTGGLRPIKGYLFQSPVI